jgi:S-adenosylmethionine synthetase
VELRPGSAELAGTLAGGGFSGATANDTSAVVGYAPLTETERLVIEAERHLNGPAGKGRFPQTGEDVKVMGVRRENTLELTVAIPLLDRHVEKAADYFERRRAITDDLSRHLAAHQRRIQRLSLSLNALDDPTQGMAGMYLSVLGTSAEDADSGQVGRGNQVNGVISLCRPRGAEAAAGKNPVSHVGKIYSVLAFQLAQRLCGQVPGVDEAVVFLCSRIGDPIKAPRTAWVRVHTKPGAEFGDLERMISDQCDREFAGLPAFCRGLAKGQLPVC